MKQAKVIKMKHNREDEKPAVTETAEQYQNILRSNPLDQKAYNRLMIIYRKLKAYKKELDIINSAIKSFERFYQANKKNADRKVSSISKQLNKALGLTDNKGKAIHVQEPIATWRKRKELLLKRMKKE